MLLVNDGKAKIPELHSLLYQGVCADDDPDRTIGKAFQNRSSRTLGRGPHQQLATDSGRSQVSGDVGVMLLCKNLGRSHDAGLTSVPDGDQGREHGYHCLSRPDITLKQTVHLTAAYHVSADFLNHTLLRSGKFIWQSLVAGVESRADLGHRNPYSGAAADIFLLQQRQLQQEQLLPFETVTRLLKSRLVGRKMNITDGKPQRNKTFLPKDIFRQCLFNITNREVDRLGHKPVHHLAGHSPVFKSVSGIIDTGQGSGETDGTAGRRIVYLGMHHVQLSVEQAWLSEKKEHRTWFQAVVSVFDTLEEDKFHGSALILHQNTQTLPADLRRDHLGQNLDVRAAGADISDHLNGTAVYVTKRKCVQKVSDCGYTKFRPEQRSPFRPHPGQELNVRLLFVSHHSHKYNEYLEANRRTFLFLKNQKGFLCNDEIISW